MCGAGVGCRPVMPLLAPASRTIFHAERCSNGFPTGSETRVHQVDHVEPFVDSLCCRWSEGNNPFLSAFTGDPTNRLRRSDRKCRDPWPPNQKAGRIDQLEHASVSQKPTCCMGCSTTIAASECPKIGVFFVGPSGFVAGWQGSYQCVSQHPAVKTPHCRDLRAIVAGASSCFLS